MFVDEDALDTLGFATETERFIMRLRDMREKLLESPGDKGDGSLSGERTVHGLAPKVFVRWDFNNGVQVVGREEGQDFHVENMYSQSPRGGSGEAALRWLSDHYEAIVPRTIMAAARPFWKKMFERGVAVPFRERQKDLKPKAIKENTSTKDNAKKFPDGSSYTEVIEDLKTQDRNETFYQIIEDHDGDEEEAIEFILERIQDQFEFIKEKAGSVIWRGLEDVDDASSISYSGIHWSFSKSVAKSFSNKGLLMEGVLDIGSVNWVKTISSRLDWVSGEEEDEITMKEGTTVFVKNIYNINGKNKKVINEKLPTSN